MKYALIDMGSNSIRLTVYEIDKTGFKPLFKEKIMAGLAGYVEHGRLNGDGIECAGKSLKEFKNTLKLLDIDRLSVFATASLRNISNTAQAVEQIERSTGIKVEILSGEEEAECGFYGAACDVDMNDGLFTDIGGASTELVYFSGRKLKEAGSVPVGSLRLYRDCVKNIIPGKGSRLRIEETIAEAFDSNAVRQIPKMDHIMCVGGTSRACLRLCRRLFGLSDDSRTFTTEQLNGLYDRLSENDRYTADIILRCEPERIHTLIPGMMILRYITDNFGIKDITVSSCGVREGYLCRRVLPLVQ